MIFWSRAEGATAPVNHSVIDLYPREGQNLKVAPKIGPSVVTS